MFMSVELCVDVFHTFYGQFVQTQINFI